MNSKYLVYLLTGVFLLLGAETSFPVSSDTFTSGKDWNEKMSKGEKFISVYAPMILFHRYGINFRKTPDEYAETLDQVLMENPYLEKEDVVNIFASTVYAYEPESRRAFVIMKMELANEYLKPALLVKKRLNTDVNDL
ncbi:MAG: hypothetical protein AUJ72_04870 [Candidatus Omnitrophica bacterium CG1_02_46_14]|nr:MAG: hypothetical protein AUJ72_04870 [Candidatus Omnitrophica bacterium CG1_02_46_14]